MPVLLVLTAKEQTTESAEATTPDDEVIEVTNKKLAQAEQDSTLIGRA